MSMADAKNSGLSPVFQKEDAAQPDFWEKRFAENFTPWDAGRVPEALEKFLRAEPRGQRVLIPGCGSGYEVRAFAEAGFETLAIDFAPAAVDVRNGPWDRSRTSFASRISLNPISPHRSTSCTSAPSCARCPAALAALCAAGVGALAVRRKARRIFLLRRRRARAALRLKAGELEDLLGRHFVRTADASVSDSIPIFAGKERWQIWTRSTLPSA